MPTTDIQQTLVPTPGRGTIPLPPRTTRRDFPNPDVFDRIVQDIYYQTLIRSELDLLRNIRANPHTEFVKRLLARNIRQLDGDIRGFTHTALTGFLERSSETKEGRTLEAVIITTARHTHGSIKAPEKLFPGVDLLHTPDGDTLEVWGIKTGVHWGNQSQRSQLASDLRAAKDVLAPVWGGGDIRIYNGVVYGPPHTRPVPAHNPVYHEMVGDKFLSHLFGEPDLGRRIQEALRAADLQYDAARRDAFDATVNSITEWVTYHAGGGGWTVLLELAQGTITPQQAAGGALF